MAEEEKKAEAARSSDRFICLRSMGSLGSEWYLMDLEKLTNMEKLNMEKNNKKKKNIDECIIRPLLSADSEATASSVSMGTDFYILGGGGYDVVEENGYSHCSRRALKFDATHPEQGFVEVPSMLNARALSLPKAFKGKIYVFGGLSSRKEYEYFGECFDPKLQKWTPIDYPCVGQDHLEPAGVGTIAIPYDENHLLVGPFAIEDDDNWYCLYDVESNSWTIFGDSRIFSDFSYLQPVKVGNTLYFRRLGDIRALDLESGIHYRGPVKGRVIECNVGCVIDLYGSRTTLFHLGGDDFCFFTNYLPVKASYHDPSSFRVCCTKVRVVKKDGGYLDATIVSTLFIPGAIRIVDTTPVDEIFVNSLPPDTEKAAGSGLLANIGRCILLIGMVGLLTIVSAGIRGRVVRTGGKQRVAHHAEGLHLDKQAVHKEVTAVDTLREESCGDNSIIYMCNFWIS